MMKSSINSISYIELSIVLGRAQPSWSWLWLRGCDGSGGVGPLKPGVDEIVAMTVVMVA